METVAELAAFCVLCGMCLVVWALHMLEVGSLVTPVSSWAL